MILFPAIDLKDGACVRLLHGEMDQATIFNNDPAKQARHFARDGFEWIHLVDLNGAIAGHPVNDSAVNAVLKAVDIPVQLGGGIRNLSMIEHWLSRGVARVILGTVALENPGLVIEACGKFPGKIAVGIDARDGLVATKGWVETSEVEATELALRFEDAGAAAIIYTDINRDGALQGVNAEATAALAEKIETPVIASGGVNGLADLEALLAVADKGIAGVISGRAIYDGRLDPAQALTFLRKNRAANA